MPPFPKSRLKPTRATLATSPLGGHSIYVYLEPFELDSEEVETIFEFDDIQGLPDRLEECVGKAMEFPTNPEDGFVDGSIYLGHGHQIADLTRLSFERVKKRIVATLDIVVELSEGLETPDEEEYEGFDIQLCVPIEEGESLTISVED